MSASEGSLQLTEELKRIHACHLSRNPASGHVLEKLGMAHEGTLRQHVLKWGSTGAWN